MAGAAAYSGVSQVSVPISCDDAVGTQLLSDILALGLPAVLERRSGYAGALDEPHQFLVISLPPTNPINSPHNKEKNTDLEEAPSSGSEDQSADQSRFTWSLIAGSGDANSQKSTSFVWTIGSESPVTIESEIRNLPEPLSLESTYPCDPLGDSMLESSLPLRSPSRSYRLSPAASSFRASGLLYNSSDGSGRQDQLLNEAARRISSLHDMLRTVMTQVHLLSTALRFEDKKTQQTPLALSQLVPRLSSLTSHAQKLLLSQQRHIDDLAEQNAELGRRISQLIRDHGQCVDQSAQYQNEKSELLLVVKSLQEQVESLKLMYDKELTQVRTNYQAAMSEAEAARSASEARLSQYNESEAKCEELSVLLQNTEAHVDEQTSLLEYIADTLRLALHSDCLEAEALVSSTVEQLERIPALETELETKNERIRDLEAELSEAVQRHGESFDELERLNSKMVEQRQVIERLIDAEKQARLEVAEADRKTQEAEETLKRANATFSEAAQIRKQSEAVGLQLEENRSKAERLQADLDNAMRRLGDAELRCQSAHEALEAEKEQSRITTAGMEAAKAQIERLRTNTSAANSRCQRLEEDLASAHTAISERERAIADLQTQVASLSGRVSASAATESQSRKRVDEVRQRIRWMEAMLTGLRNENEELKGKLVDATQELQRAATERDGAKQAAAESDRAAQRAGEELTRAVTECRKLRRRVDMMPRLQAELSASEARANELAGNADTLLRELSASKSQVQRERQLRQQAEQNQSPHVNVAQRVQAVAELATAQRELTAAQDEIIRLQNRCEELQQELSEDTDKQKGELIVALCRIAAVLADDEQTFWRLGVTPESVSQVDVDVLLTFVNEKVRELTRGREPEVIVDTRSLVENDELRRRVHEAETRLANSAADTQRLGDWVRRLNQVADQAIGLNKSADRPITPLYRSTYMPDCFTSSQRSASLNLSGYVSPPPLYPLSSQRTSEERVRELLRKTATDF